MPPGYRARPVPSPVKRRMPDAEYCILLAYVLLGSAILGSIYLLANIPPNLSVIKALLALGIIWLGIAPAFIYLLGKSADELPFLPILGAAFALYYGFTAFSHDHTFGLLNPRMVTVPALVTALGGFILLYAGFALSKFLLSDIVRPLQLPVPANDSWLQAMVWFLMLAHLAFLRIPAFQHAPSVSSIQVSTGYIAFGLLYFLWRRQRLPIYQRFAFFFCIAAEVLWRFTSGVLAQIVLLAMFFQLVIWYERRRIPWMLIVIAVLIFMGLQPVKAEYRKYTWGYGRYANLNSLGKARLFTELAIKFYSGGIHSSRSEVGGAAADRLADIRILSYVIQQTPEPIPYWHGKTYKLLFSGLVPRILWPSKPAELVGQDFGHRYGLLVPEDTTTSINLPWIAEMYANFGYAGVLIGMPLLGVLFGLLMQKFGRPGMNFLNFTVGTAIIFRASVDQENNLSLILGSIVPSTVVMSLYFYLGYWLNGLRLSTAENPARFRFFAVRTKETPSVPDAERPEVTPNAS